MEFRDSVRAMRSELGVSQGELSSALNMNLMTVSRWECGKTVPSRSTLLRLLEYGRTRGVSEYCLENVRQSAAGASARRLGRWQGSRTQAPDDLAAGLALPELPGLVFDRLLELEYEQVLLINAATGEFSNYTTGGGSLLGEICGLKCADMEDAKKHLRERLARADADRVLSELSLPYIKERLKTQKSHSVIFTLKDDRGETRKRTTFSYLDSESTRILCTLQNISDIPDRVR